MKERRKPLLVREQLDHSLAKLKSLADSRRPVRGWLRAIRAGLGLSGVELARRLGVKPPRIVEMEKNELEGAITLKVLERAAEAMGCTLVYALIPRAGSLDQTLKDRAKSQTPEVPFGAILGPSDSGDVSGPSSPDESFDLRLPHLSTRGELGRWERQGIQDAEAWAFPTFTTSPKTPASLNAWPTEKWLRSLHGKMFGQVWKSAGGFRVSESDSGSPVREIPVKLQELCENVRHWSKAKVHPPEEACMRFHSRLLSIRPFARGNGRFARLMTDLIAVRIFGMARFSWGTNTGLGPELRKRYQEALRAAAGREYKPLIAFSRS